MDAAKASCVLAGNCTEGTYPDPSTRTCVSCDYSCLTCSGPTNSDCILCNFAKGYATSSTGKCYALVCAEGQYLSKNNITRKATCLACDASCSTCDAAGKENCIECRSGLTATTSTVADRVVCKTCEQINSGFVTASDGTCKGIALVWAK